MKNKLGRWLKKIFLENSSAKSVALGCAVGVFFALTPFLGLHLVLTLLTVDRLKANKASASAAVYVSNPLTFIPIYLAAYWLGSFLLGQKINNTEFKIFLDQPDWHSLIHLGFKILLPLTLGSMIMAAVSGVITYYSVLWLLKKWSRKKKTVSIS